MPKENGHYKRQNVSCSRVLTRIGVECGTLSAKWAITYITISKYLIGKKHEGRNILIIVELSGRQQKLKRVTRNYTIDIEREICVTTYKQLFFETWNIWIMNKCKPFLTAIILIAIDWYTRLQIQSIFFFSFSEK